MLKFCILGFCVWVNAPAIPAIKPITPHPRIAFQTPTDDQRKVLQARPQSVYPPIPAPQRIAAAPSIFWAPPERATQPQPPRTETVPPPQAPSQLQPQSKPTEAPPAPSTPPAPAPEANSQQPAPPPTPPAKEERRSTSSYFGPQPKDPYSQR
jgi:hypothetical protein